MQASPLGRVFLRFREPGQSQMRLIFRHQRFAPAFQRIGEMRALLIGDGEFRDGGVRLAAIQKGLPTLWTETAPGVWSRETLSDEPNGLIPRGVNNAGMVVGRREDPQGRTHAVVWTREGGLKELHKPQGYEHSLANAVNNAGVVVGQIDGPHGSKVGPNAFVYEAGRLRILEEGGPYFVAATAINDAGQVAGVFEREDEAPATEDAPKPEKAP